MRLFFRTRLRSLEEAGAVIGKLRTFGELLDYKFIRCPETKRYLGHGFASYKPSPSVQEALVTKFHTFRYTRNGPTVQLKLERSSELEGKKGKLRFTGFLN
ncbi:hypothetical protein BZG36_01056 [Bifiguratus adelaidae]|uniref:RRM domain-containing protein n=1 Tax=Bifiguratus adelaidae TaxID=1938954 RepID=A0A261Y691_9FUNG|nr:hypothetical protein BZG36_01056 [Bifiguratus adelaidae]